MTRTRIEPIPPKFGVVHDMDLADTCEVGCSLADTCGLADTLADT